jgi:hypothetical protein
MRRWLDGTEAGFARPFEITLPAGWTVWGIRPDLVALFHAAPPAGWIDVVIVAATLEPPCRETAPTFIEQTPEAVVDWLATRDWLDHGAPRPYNVGSYLGRAIEVAVPATARYECAGIGNETPSMFRLGSPNADESFGALYNAEPGERKQVVAIDVGGRTVTLVIGSPFADVDGSGRSLPILQTPFSEPP